MNPSFDIAFSYMMANEDFKETGEVTPEPNGAKARFGINSLAHPQAVTDGFYTMPTAYALNYARSIYFSQYWIQPGISKLPTQAVANKVFDMAVNMGSRTSILLLQKALLSLKVNIDIDGILGPMTVELARLKANELLSAIRSEQRAYYEILVERNPTLEPYLKGWLVRADK